MAKNIKIYFVAILVILASLQSEAINIEDVENAAKNETLVVEKLKEVILGLKDLMKEGNETLKVPVTDPLEIDSKDLDIDTSQFRGHFSFGSVNITGLSDYIVNNVAFRNNDFLLQIALEWPKINLLVSNYNISNGKIMKIFKAKGSGSVRLAAKNIKYAINSTIGINRNDSTLYLKDIDNNISIGNKGDKNSIEVEHLGKKNKSNMLSKMLLRVLNKNAVKMLNKNNKLIESKLKEIIQLTVNEYLRTKTLEQLYGLL
ncbi:uncharacterized protein LOC122498699 [Leptopilina heterotoma]|uniref:uncharacterized protein LOC122498699 n=1 Tax=Leptopilina heterotoma TaxID=63436 RepID=UPI001CA9FD09|nr:uncharacterized protein LOC122498699 [Leptopilina heterotoma]